MPNGTYGGVRGGVKTPPTRFVQMQQVCCARRVWRSDFQSLWRAGHASALSRRNRIGMILQDWQDCLGCAQRTTLALDVGHGLALVVARPTYKR